MILNENTLDEILIYLEYSIANLAKDVTTSHEFQMSNDDLIQFLSDQYDIRLDNLLQRKNSNIHHLESNMKNKTIQRKQFLLDSLKKELNSK